ncbi:hypothetical protein LTR84_007747 [Exophiala bonariae]|uniref:Uncharacterized protein n=1 Tax=Exophiala bonariae TaxID=1690606 RepID=A0AAV9NPS3_9EURO|nr:hypothetical protein LTR84_007747 [Exophiala bonariae]
MAQGLLKNKKASASTTSAGGGGGGKHTTNHKNASSTSGVTKKGSRAVTPRKAKLLKQAKINKKYTGGLTARTEAMLGQRAGHLELLGQGRKKTSGAAGGAAAADKAKGAKKGIKKS